MRTPTRLALMTAGAAAGALAVRRGVRRLLDVDVAADLYDWRGPARTGVDVGSAVIDLPIRYRHDECFMGVFAADLAAVAAVLPSERLHPIRLGRDEAAVAIVAYDYFDTSVGSYGEVGVAVLCTLDRPGPPLLPAVMESKWPGFGGFVTHLPVTTTIARDAGRSVWGYPKFVADMRFEHSGTRHSVNLAEGGTRILDLEVDGRGPAVTDNRALTTYSVLDGELIRTTIPMRARYRLGLSGGGRVSFGDHPVGRQLTSWGLRPEAAFTKTYVARGAMLPEGERLGAADRAYPPYEPAPPASVPPGPVPSDPAVVPRT